MDSLAQLGFYASTGLQLLAFLALAVVGLIRLPQRWAAVALVAALVSLVPVLWFAAANVVIQGSLGGPGTFEFFYSPAPQLLMQFLSALGVVLVVAAVLLGRGSRKEAPVEGPTGTTFRQLPGNIDWK